MANSVEDEVALEKSEKRAMEDSSCHDSHSKHVNTTTLSELPKKETGELQNSEKLLNEEQQNQGSDFTNGLAIVVSSELNNLHRGRSSDTGSRGSSTFTGGMPSSTPERVTDQQRQNLNSGNYLLQCDKQIRPRYPSKALEDGYNWRKYGQKLVKGNEFVRSYYRCTHIDCKAKRQVELSQDGHITDTVYIGKHEHIKPQPGSQVAFSCVSPIQSIELDDHPLAAEEDKSFDAHGPTPASHVAKSVGSPRLQSTPSTKNVLDCSNPEPVQPNLRRDGINHDGDPPSKKLKRHMCGVDDTPVEKPCVEPRFVGEPRVVVHTTSEVDILQDGYRWRKYGQKLVKGNPNPRSYYRCSSSGCPAKKHVERASHDMKLVITTYEGQHDHDLPPARTVTPNKGGASANTTALEDETRSKPEEKPAVGLDMVVHISAS